jgi:hypothetical protein
MQRIHEHQRAIDRQPAGAALLAEQAQQLGLGEAFQPAADEP